MFDADAETHRTTSLISIDHAVRMDLRIDRSLAMLPDSAHAGSPAATRKERQ